MKMSQLKMVIREVVREEIRLGLKEIVGDLKQPTNESVRKTPAKKQNFSKNPVLNEVLNETKADDWETMGGSKFTSERMSELIGGSYADMMNGDQPTNVDAEVAAMGKNPETVPDKVKDNIFNKDYSSLMKAIDKKKQQKTGA